MRELIFIFHMMLAATVIGCVHHNESQPSPSKEYAVEPTMDEGRPFAKANLIPRSNSSASGTVYFTIVPEGIRVSATVQKVKPVGLHGIHIHTVGNCSSADASSAGDHYNPTAAKHGDAHASNSHLGDFGNIKVDSSGRGELGFIVRKENISHDKWKSIIGRSIVLHAGEDDGTSQPSGNSGARIACGVIKSL